MTTLPTRSKDVIVATMAAATQGRLSRFLNFALGSVFLALYEAVAGVALWLQGLVLGVLKISRAATSDGPDLDSWVNDYGMTRLPAVAATGVVTFGRLTAGPSAVPIPVGAVVQTGDGSQRFTVYADTTNPAFDPPSQTYIMPALLGSLDVPVSAQVPGSAGNVAAGQISLLASSVPSIDTVTNAVAFTAGTDPEADPALRARIPGYFASLSKGTEAAIAYAITSLGLGLSVGFLYNTPAQGQPYITAVVDDGSGQPADTLVQAAAAATLGVRAGGVWVPVIGATPLWANVAMLITSAPGYARGDVLAAVKGAVTLFVNGLGQGNPLRWAKIEQIAFEAHPGVIDVSGLTINGGTVNLVPTGGQTIKAQTVVVS